MGSVYRRSKWTCTTCKKRLDKTADRESCTNAGHTISERQSKVWWVNYRSGGRSYAESSGSDRKKDAIALLQQKEGDIQRGKPITPRLGKVTFEDAAADLLAEYKSNDRRSYHEVERRLRLHLTPYFGGWRMANITTPDIDRFINKRQTEDTVLVKGARTHTDKDGNRTTTPEVRRPASNAEINRELAVLKRMFSLAVQAGKLLHKPTIKMRREASARAGFFEPAQYESVLAHLPAAIRPVVTFAYLTGWRIASEVLPLQWRRVDFDAGEIRLDAGTTKNREGRVFPMTEDLLAVLKAQRAEHERLKKSGVIVPFVFFRLERGGDKKPMPIISFKRAWQSACRAAGCPGRIPHDLRRTAVRNLVRVGIPERVAMQMTGHKTRSVFERYNIVSSGDLRDAARKLDNAMLSANSAKPNPRVRA